METIPYKTLLTLTNTPPSQLLPSGAPPLVPTCGNRQPDVAAVTSHLLTRGFLHLGSKTKARRRCGQPRRASARVTSAPSLKSHFNSINGDHRRC